jgi:hypothetical protein
VGRLQEWLRLTACRERKEHWKTCREGYAARYVDSSKWAESTPPGFLIRQLKLTRKHKGECREPAAARGRASSTLNDRWMDDYVGLPYALPLMELLQRHACSLAFWIVRTLLQFHLEAATCSSNGIHLSPPSLTALTTDCN